MVLCFRFNPVACPKSPLRTRCVAGLGVMVVAVRLHSC